MELTLKSEEQRLESSGKAQASAIAVSIALISWAMLFVTLFMAYALYRANSTVWPPAGFGQVSLLFPSLSTLTIVLSSLCFVNAKASYLKEDRAYFVKWLYGTFFLGAGFLFLQMKLWSYLQLAGVYKHSGIFGSIIYGFTWIHFAHVVLGLIGLAWLRFVMRKSNTKSREHNFLWVQSLGKFWHFLGIVWIVMYLSIFVF